MSLGDLTGLAFRGQVDWAFVGLVFPGGLVYYLSFENLRKRA